MFGCCHIAVFPCELTFCDANTVTSNDPCTSFQHCKELRVATMTDMIADLGRSVRVRYGHSIDQRGLKEITLPVYMDMQEAYALLEAAHAADHSGQNASTQFYTY